MTTLPVTAWWGEHLGSTVLASADYSTTGQFLFVTVNSSGQAVLVTSQGVGQVKVLVNAPKQNDPAFLWDIGETKVTAGAAITAGSLVMTNSSGQAITYVNNGVNVPVGEARMSTLTGSGDLITVFMWPTPSASSFDNLFSAQGNQTALVSPGLTLTGEMVNVSTGASSGIVIMPAALAGAVFMFADDQGATHGTAITPAGSDTIRGGTPGTITTAAAHETYIFFCSHVGNWEYVKSA